MRSTGKMPAKGTFKKRFVAYRLKHSENVAALSALFDQAPQYFVAVEGRPSTYQDALDALTELPPGKEISDKFFGGYWKDGTLVGCMDLIRGYPEPDIAFLGLLLLSDSHQSQGLGVQALAHIAGLSRSWGCTALRLAVIDKNERGLAFWKREGFQEIYRKPTSRFTGETVVMQTALAAPSGRLRPLGQS